MEIITARIIKLMWDGNQICALIGGNTQDGVSGFGSTDNDALRDLLAKLEEREITIWVRRFAKPYKEDGELKFGCPECGAVATASDDPHGFIHKCLSCRCLVEVVAYKAQDRES